MKKKEKENRFLRQFFIYLCSFVLVGVVVCGVVFAKRATEQKKYEEKQINSQQELEASQIEQEAQEEQELQKEQEALEEAQAAMSQEDMENLFDTVQYEAEGVDEEQQVQETDADIPVDFIALQEVNPDVYAWISVPGTEIEYPILQHATDNTYYLNYNIDGSYGYPGCIYTENLNAKDFSDANTVIYGHNMKNGTMFAQLHKFEDAVFFDEHREVLIYTPEKKYCYTIFAAYVYDDRHLLYNFDFSDTQVYERYLNDIFERRDMSANIRTDMDVTCEDKIITLVTCMSQQPEKRLLVQAVLNKEL